jgi:hypothetical protein
MVISCQLLSSDRCRVSCFSCPRRALDATPSVAELAIKMMVVEDVQFWPPRRATPSGKRVLVALLAASASSTPGREPAPHDMRHAQQKGRIYDKRIVVFGL